MRVLFITAYFPPCDFGWGYMRICEQIADGLHKRGHDVAVLTSTYRHAESEIKPYPVYRQLIIEPDWHAPQSPMKQFFFGRRRREREAIAHLETAVARFQPDLLFVWDAYGLSKVMLRHAEQMPGVKVAYYFANYLPEYPGGYFEYWHSAGSKTAVKILKAPLALIAKTMLKLEGKPIPLAYEHTISVSHYVRDRLRRQNLIGADAIVAPNGIDIPLFQADVVQPEPESPLRCLIAGRVVPEKGVHTLIEAFALLKQEGLLSQVRLTVLGDGPAEYKEHLKQQVLQYGLDQAVTFADPVPVTKMPECLKAHDIVMLPSEWDEPLSCAMLEGMAAGRLVIGTTRGGSGEVLADGRTGLTFTAGDPASLAEKLKLVIADRTLVTRLAEAGQAETVRHFNMDVSVERIESYLMGLLADTAVTAPTV